MADNIVRVGIAVVESEGRYLVGTRPAGTALAGHAEFPGGKCLSGEQADACAVRECREESGLIVSAVRRLYACRHSYPHGTVELEFWLCRPVSPPEACPAAGTFEWLAAQTLQSLRFPEANRPVIEQIAAGPLA